MTAVDITLVKQNKVAVFVYNSSDLDENPQFLGIISRAAITGMTKSAGALNPIYAKSPSTGEIQIIDKSRSAPDLGELTLEEYFHKAALNYLEKLFKLRCEQTWLIKIDTCGRMDDPYTFDSFFLVEGIQETELDFGSIQSFDADEVNKFTGTLNYLQSNRLLPINFGEVAADTVLAEVLDIISADAVSCGTCSPFSSGCEKWYAITKANPGSPGLSGQFIYTLNNWGTETALDINGLGGQSPSDLFAAGIYFVIVAESDGAHYVIRKDSLVAGGFSRVTSGYQVGGSPTAGFAKSPTEIIIVGLGGYIYSTSDPTTGVTVVHDGSQTVQPGNNVHANGQVWVSVHDSNTIMYSINNGESFVLLVTAAGLNGPEAGANLTAVWVRSPYQWYVTTNTGKLWYSSDQGETWTQRTLPNQGNLQTIFDIKFSDESDEVGAIAVRTNSRGYVYRTFSGGRQWYQDKPAIGELMNNSKINAIALCGVNIIGAAGLKPSASTDGLITIAS